MQRDVYDPLIDEKAVEPGSDDVHTCSYWFYKKGWAKYSMAICCISSIVFVCVMCGILSHNMSYWQWQDMMNSLS
jgi:hypothetical protein